MGYLLKGLQVLRFERGDNRFEMWELGRRDMGRGEKRGKKEERESERRREVL